MKKVINFSIVLFLFSFYGCAGLKPQMIEILGSEGKKYSYTHENLSLEFKVPVKATEYKQDCYFFTGNGMPTIFVDVFDQALPGGYAYNSIEWYVKAIGGLVFNTVRPDGYDWNEVILIEKETNLKEIIGYITRKHEKLLVVYFQRIFTNEELSEIKGLKYKTKALAKAFTELDSWVKIVSPGKEERYSITWKETSEKIEKLGELYNKGFITKEEYEAKKAELLRSY